MMKQGGHFSFENDLFFAILAAFYGSLSVFWPFFSPSNLNGGNAVVDCDDRLPFGCDFLKEKEEMKQKDELRLAYSLAVILLLIGVLAYAALPLTPPDEPVRVVFKNKAGKVIFDHKEHSAYEGYGYRCEDCHHDIAGEGERPEACGECHMPDDEDVLNRSDAFHALCEGCHDHGGLGPVDCAGCHIL
jgi:hypothetical protein